MAEEPAKTRKNEKVKVAAPKDEKPVDERPKGGKGEGKAAATPKGAETPAVPAVPLTAAQLLGEGETNIKIKKVKGAKNVSSAVAHVFSSYNNTLVSITDQAGNVIGWSSAGRVGFKGSKKSTSYAAQLVAQDAGRQAMAHGVKECEVQLKGPGSGRESAVRALQAIGIEVTAIRDVTPIPHNGCRPRKQRRV
jgi:small subunit ribosomal protein S11